MNTAWDYPVTPGYYADFNWVVLRTEDGPITIMIDQDNLYLRLFSQQDGDHPRYTKMIWPDGDISFLYAIPAMGTKFKPAETFGPMSQKFQAKGNYSGRLYFISACRNGTADKDNIKLSWSKTHSPSRARTGWHPL